jgi:hypothetical protein
MWSLQALLMAVWRESQRQGADPLGSGLPVHQHGLGIIPEGAQSGTLDEPAGQLPRQRCCRELLQSAQAGADTAPDLQDPRRGRQDVFDYIEMFYNPKRKHVRNGMLSPVEFERQQEMRTEGV